MNVEKQDEILERFMVAYPEMVDSWASDNYGFWDDREAFLTDLAYEILGRSMTEDEADEISDIILHEVKLYVRREKRQK